ncbi:putative lipid II flippase FtsW [Parafrankia sp. FMc2]|uniref:putative lipid II flippase FtsW n=1 Tax=Parafrankia sp. FMc2 TaxID=3233196 RepID=UPI0034D3BEE6
MTGARTTGPHRVTSGTKGTGSPAATAVTSLPPAAGTTTASRVAGAGGKAAGADDAAGPTAAGAAAAARPAAATGPAGAAGADQAWASDPRTPILDRPMASYYLLLSSAGLLLLLGLVMVLSASSVRSFQDFGSSYTLFLRQATWAAIGIPLLMIASRLPVRVFRAAAYPLLGITLVLLLAVLVPGIGHVENGARQWIPIGPYTLQPSEFAKISLLLWCSDVLVRKRRLLVDWKHLVVPVVPGFLFVDLLLMLEPDLGGAICVTVVPLAVLWVIGTPLRIYASLLGGMVLCATILAVSAPYRLERLMSFRDPFADPDKSGYQAVQGIYALSSGGWWGEGLGASKEKWPDLLPAVHTDFILAIIGEELGLLGSLVTVGLFGVMGYAGLRIAHRTDDLFIRLAAAGVTAWLIAQAVVNMGAVVGLLPITGVTLPLVSFGGSALLPTMGALGMLLAFARCEPDAASYLAARAEARRAGRTGRWLRRRRAEPAARGATAAPGEGAAATGAGGVALDAN